MLNKSIEKMGILLYIFFFASKKKLSAEAPAATLKKRFKENQYL